MDSNDDADLEATIRSVAGELEQVRLAHENFLRETKGRFNVFTVLRQGHDERGLHSNWIAYLLDPSKEHDCGPLFLELFLESLILKGAQPHDDSAKRCYFDHLRSVDCSTAKLHTEYAKIDVVYGNIDIVIEFPGQIAIGIENKINANEQDCQITRYSKILESEFSSHELLYLTLDGKQSYTCESLVKEYRRISYAELILDWNKRCLEATHDYPNINHAIQQYDQIVRLLTGVTTMADMKLVKDIVIKNPGIANHAGSILAAVEEIQQERCKSFFDALNDAIKKKGLEISRTLLGRFETLIVSSNHAPVQSQPFKKVVEREGSIEFLSMGVKRDPAIPWPVETRERQNALHASLSNTFEGTHGNRNDGWLHYVDIRPKLFEPKALPELIAAGETLPRVAADIADKIFAYVQAVETTWATP